MLIKDLFQETYLAITANKARSTLTILGIVIGISSVIAMVSIGQGAQKSITSSIEAGGANILTISPGAQRSFGAVRSEQGSAQSLTNEDVQAISSLSSVAAISPEVSRRYQVTSKVNNSNVSVDGVRPEYQAVKNIKLSAGTFISSTQDKGVAKVAVLGATVAADLFGENFGSLLGQSVRINSINFKVVGVLETTGSGFNSADDTILVPITTAQQYFTGNEYLSNITAQVSDQTQISQAETDITDLLLARHNIASADQADFRVRNIQEMVAVASSVTGTLTALLGAIAGISLVVGGIGIMNMMLTTVTERTREIGLRKAMGAKSQEISQQFLAEAVMLTFIGGAVGIILGWLASLLVGRLLSMTTAITISSVLLAFGVAVGVGIIFGYYPARRAAKLKPIEALRYE